MRRFVLVFALSLSFSALAAGPETLSPRAADSLLAASAKAPGSLAVLDVRTPGEYSQGHLRGALLIDVTASDFEAKVGKLPRAARYLVYCRSGHRSGIALSRMKAMGFEHVQHVAGGIQAWQAAGLAVTR
jgi:phage shock protein E